MDIKTESFYILECEHQMKFEQKSEGFYLVPSNVKFPFGEGVVDQVEALMWLSNVQITRLCSLTSLCNYPFQVVGYKHLITKDKTENER